MDSLSSASMPSTAVTKPTSDAQLIQEFINDCKDRDFTPETIRKYCRAVRMFMEFIEARNRAVTEIDKYILRDFIHYRRENGIDQYTIEGEFTGLSAFYGFLVFEGYCANNPIVEVRKRYLRRYKVSKGESPRKLISVDEMSVFLNSILNIRDKAVCVLLAKTGIRRSELIAIDLQDVNWRDQSITLKNKRFRKRSNREVFFDDECTRALKRWLSVRATMDVKSDALFVGEHGERLNRNGIYTLVTKYAEKLGLHKADSNRIEDHFSPHNFRHWFTTHLIRNGMPREYVKELRGDARREAIDIYHHIDREELRKMYLACIPQLGI